MNDMMEMHTKTVYEQFPETFENLREGGWVNIYALSKVIFSITEFDEIVSKNHGASRHWFNKPVASSITEKRAQAYLEGINNPVLSQPVLELIPMAKPKPEMVTFMVNVPAEYLEKWQVFSDILKTKGCQIVAF